MIKINGGGGNNSCINHDGGEGEREEEAIMKRMWILTAY